MDMMSKTELRSGEMDTVQRSRTYSGVDCKWRSANTRGGTSVRSRSKLGKLCENHRYSYEWFSYQKPRLTKDGKTTICKAVISFLLSFQDYPPILKAVRLQHRHHWTR